MPTINFILHDGQKVAVEAYEGSSVMHGAMDAMVEGIVAECGGACSCATCQIYVDEAWMEKVGPAWEVEQEMLSVAPNVQANSRLSCQVEVTDELDGLVVHVPAEQY